MERNLLRGQLPVFPTFPKPTHNSNTFVYGLGYLYIKPTNQYRENQLIILIQVTFLKLFITLNILDFVKFYNTI